ARSGRVAGLRPLPLWVPPVYLLHHRLVDVQGYVSIDNNRYSVPNDLIGRRVEVRQTKEHIETYRGPRLVAVHRRVLEPTGRKYRLPEHVYKRGQAPPRVDSAPLEKTLLERLPEIAEYLQALKKHYPGHYLTPRLRRLLEMLNDYPRPVLLEALETARHYGLFDLERVETLILRKIAEIVEGELVAARKASPSYSELLALAASRGVARSTGEAAASTRQSGQPAGGLDSGVLPLQAATRRFPPPNPRAGRTGVHH